MYEQSANGRPAQPDASKILSAADGPEMPQTMKERVAAGGLRCGRVSTKEVIPDQAAFVEWQIMGVGVVLDLRMMGKKRKKIHEWRRARAQAVNV